jgi:ABC-type uncharacterized transport system fused permease/ATPase subunit
VNCQTEHFTKLPTGYNGKLGSFISYGSNILLHGPKGCGKSSALYLTTMWALDNNWIVFKMPSARLVT